MDAADPAFLIREARPGDYRAMLRLARELDSINLPSKRAELQDLLVRSERSFRGEIRSRARAVYVFCAEENASGRLVAASMIIAKHGTPEAPHCYLEVDADERYSHTLRKMFRHTYLQMRYSMNGPTEIGGLIVTPSMRGHPEKVGKQISWARFLYIAKRPARFERRIIAEMLAPMTPDHGNLFWDHYGRKVTGLTFDEADRLSTHDKEFIRTLFPESPLYTFLLPDDVRESLGTVGEATRGAVRLLEQAGMKLVDQIDPFDAGPYYGGETEQLVPVRNTRSYVADAGAPPESKTAAYLVAFEDADGWRAVKAFASVARNRLTLGAGVLKTLRIKPGARVDAVALP